MRWKHGPNIWRRNGATIAGSMELRRLRYFVAVAETGSLTVGRSDLSRAAVLAARLRATALVCEKTVDGLEPSGSSGSLCGDLHSDPKPTLRFAQSSRSSVPASSARKAIRPVNPHVDRRPV